jgi:hypothetical protein
MFFYKIQNTNKNHGQRVFFTDIGPIAALGVAGLIKSAAIR